MALGAAAAVALSLGGCAVTTGNPASDGDTEREKKDEYRVAYIARAQADSFAAWLANEMKAAAEDYDDITLEVFDGQADDEVENRMIENAIANKFDAIIVQPNNGDAQSPYIQQAIDAGIVTITTNPRVEGLNGGDSVDANPYDQGAVVAQLALEQVPENAKVVVLTGPAGNFHSTARRDAWQKEFFDQRPDVTIVAEDTANWNKDEALTLMEDWSLANSEIDAIISMNDNMAAGALEALKGKSNFEGILAYGVDGTPEATLLIQEGLLTASTLQNARELAELNIKSVHELLTGEKDEINVDIGNPLITSDNVQEYIDLYLEAGLL
ncbi:sugar ABC transporter substrate-binding protein [Microbacterium lushaniae]|uniref:Sugar ABC transporter substrate-binding protein n=2 Tax=Microbacterium lushaniae TaxID=2614639 RepID=A0A5J6L8U6_9MICO|nr:sugar ABC transporter substrate-binding protein [Microbacterium lushaniae]